jgi:hypothetical protein
MSSQSLKLTVMALLLTTSSLFVVAQDQASNVNKLTQQEAQTRVQSAVTSKRVKALIAGAKTAEDHRKLAVYFNREADRMEADAKGHAELAEVYRQTPHSLGGGKESGAGSIFRTAEHCDSAAKSLRESAKSLRELAAEHEQMAKGVAK